MRTKSKRIPGAISLTKKQARDYFNREVALSLNGMKGKTFIKLLNSGTLRCDQNFEVSRLATLLPLAGQ